MDLLISFLFTSFVCVAWTAPTSNENEEDTPDFPFSPEEIMEAEENLISGNYKNTSLDMEANPTLNDMVDDENFRAIMRPGAPSSRKRFLWPNGVVPYKITGQFTASQRQAICMAILSIAENTCVRFIPRSNEFDYVNIVSGNDCKSSIGRRGGGQRLTLGTHCFAPYGVIIHEMLHTLSFIHEQNRPDRDQFVEIKWDNIEEEMKHNYERCDTCDTLGVSYNPGSIMHYMQGAFAIDHSKPTMRWIASNDDVTLGSPKYFFFTHKDRDQVNKLYECDVKAQVKTAVVECKDLQDNCADLKKRGDCKNKVQVAMAYCRRTCGRCHICEDANKNDCAKWVKKCTSMALREYMTLFCAKTCNTCILDTKQSKCYDVNDQNCVKWEDRGGCRRNFKYMSQYCAKSCGTCKYPVDEPLDPEFEDAVRLITKCLIDAMEHLNFDWR